MPKTHQIAVFDFDGTLYKKDTMIQFCLFIYKRYPFRLRYASIQILGAVMYLFKSITIEHFKTLFLSYLLGMSEEKVQQELKLFWASRFPKHFHPALLERLKELQDKNIACVCISASPNWMIQDACNHLGITQVLGSSVIEIEDKWVWRFNCRGKKKVAFLENALPNAVVVEAYSDNQDDHYLLDKAERGFKVQKGKIIPFTH
jgi:phosphatidylglycerophosphatase C